MLLHIEFFCFSSFLKQEAQQILYNTKIESIVMYDSEVWGLIVINKKKPLRIRNRFFVQKLQFIQTDQIIKYFIFFYSLATYSI